MSAYTASRHVFPFASRTHARMHTRTYVRKYTVRPRSIRFVKRRHSLPFSIPRTDNIVRASRRIPGSAFLAPHDLVSLSLSSSIVPSRSISRSVYPPSSYQGALLIGLSSVLTVILARERRYNRVARSSYRRAMRRRSAT